MNENGIDHKYLKEIAKYAIQMHEKGTAFYDLSKGYLTLLEELDSVIFQRDIFKKKLYASEPAFWDLFQKYIEVSDRLEDYIGK